MKEKLNTPLMVLFIVIFAAYYALGYLGLAYIITGLMDLEFHTFTLGAILLFIFTFLPRFIRKLGK